MSKAMTNNLVTGRRHWEIVAPPPYGTEVVGINGKSKAIESCTQLFTEFMSPAMINDVLTLVV